MISIDDCHIGMPVTFDRIPYAQVPRKYYNGIIVEIISPHDVRIVYGDGEFIISDLRLLNIHKKVIEEVI